MSKHSRPSSVRENFQPLKQEDRPAEAAAVPENPTADATPIPTISEQTAGAADNAEESLSNEPAAAIDTTNPALIGDMLDQACDIVDRAAGINNWHEIGELVHTHPPRNGMPVYLSDKPEGAGVLAFWKKTRAFANATKKWEDTGRWTDYMSGLPIAFEPKYWRERFV